LEPQKELNNQSNLEQNNRKQLTTWLQNILQSTSNQNSRFWLKNRHTDEWQKAENLVINLCIHSQLIFKKGTKNMQISKVL
jgi:hypothetical protein